MAAATSALNPDTGATVVRRELLPIWLPVRREIALRMVSQRARRGTRPYSIAMKRDSVISSIKTPLPSCADWKDIVFHRPLSRGVQDPTLRCAAGSRRLFAPRVDERPWRDGCAVRSGAPRGLTLWCSWLTARRRVTGLDRRITGGDRERLEIAASHAADAGLAVWFSPSHVT